MESGHENVLLPEIVMEYAVVMENFVSEGGTELSVRRGDFVHVLYHVESRWAYVCRQLDKRVGYIPHSFLAFIATPPQQICVDSQLAVGPQPLRRFLDAGSCSSGRSSSEECMLLQQQQQQLHQQQQLQHQQQQYTPHPLPILHPSMKKTRSEPDGGSWVDSLSNESSAAATAAGTTFAGFICPPSPYTDTKVSSKTRLQCGSPLPLVSSSATVAHPPPRRTHHLPSLRQDFCEPYKTIVHELEDCLEKLTLV